MISGCSVAEDLRRSRRERPDPDRQRFYLHHRASSSFSPLIKPFMPGLTRYTLWARRPRFSRQPPASQSFPRPHASNKASGGERGEFESAN
ncbi:hypothetical protein BaRGS_00034183 [Batillaria attramentaria]|uniref:Uncharacterized protein n=1 Tax=Batillaria attramentaria TaxID=370345 RepID=A0ABD0JD67_9CAEN